MELKEVNNHIHEYKLHASYDGYNRYKCRICGKMKIGQPINEIDKK